MGTGQCHGDFDIETKEISSKSGTTYAPLALQTEIIPELNNAAILQPGLTVIGQITILGVTAKAYVRVDHFHLALELDLTLDPVSLGNGLVKITAGNVVSEREIPEYMQNDGANIYTGFRIMPSRGRSWPTPEFRISGAVEVFGARVALETGITKFGFHFRTELNVWDWFRAKCIFEVICQNGGVQNGVRVYGEVTVDSITRLAKGFFNKVIKKMLKLFMGKRSSRSLLFGKVKRRGQKILKQITNVELLSVKFDINNASPDQSIPVLTEFQFTLFGKHIRYKKKKRIIHFGRPLEDCEEDEMAENAVLDLENCLAAFNEENDTVNECQSPSFGQDSLDHFFVDRDAAKIIKYIDYDSINFGATVLQTGHFYIPFHIPFIHHIHHSSHNTPVQIIISTNVRFLTGIIQSSSCSAGWVPRVPLHPEK